MQYREAKNIAVAGARGHGKSTTINQIVSNGVRKNGLLYKVHRNINDPAFKNFYTINSLAQYKGGFAKIGSGSVEYKKFLSQVLEHFKNGFVIIDDAKFFERHTLSPEANELLLMTRHIGIDVYYVYHSLKYIPVEMYELLDWLILLHTTDNIQNKLSALPEGDVLMASKERIRRQVQAGNKYYKEYIKLS